MAELRDRIGALQSLGLGASERAAKLRRALWRHRKVVGKWRERDRARRAVSRPASSAWAMHPSETRGRSPSVAPERCQLLCDKVLVPFVAAGGGARALRMVPFVRCKRLDGHTVEDPMSQEFEDSGSTAVSMRRRRPCERAHGALRADNRGHCDVWGRLWVYELGFEAQTLDVHDAMVAPRSRRDLDPL